jgi:hypothetical protein
MIAFRIWKAYGLFKYINKFRRILIFRLPLVAVSWANTASCSTSPSLEHISHRTHSLDRKVAMIAETRKAFRHHIIKHYSKPTTERQSQRYVVNRKVGIKVQGKVKVVHVLN